LGEKLSFSAGFTLGFMTALSRKVGMDLSPEGIAFFVSKSICEALPPEQKIMCSTQANMINLTSSVSTISLLVSLYVGIMRGNSKAISFVFGLIAGFILGMGVM